MNQGKEFAYDGKGSVAGDPSSLPARNDVDNLGEQAGVELAEEEVVATQEKLEQRDENRWELNVDSAESR